MDPRVERLELRVDYHEREIQELREDHHKLRTALTEISDSLKQIKWIAVGAIFYSVATESGLLAALKMLVM